MTEPQGGSPLPRDTSNATRRLALPLAGAIIVAVMAPLAAVALRADDDKLRALGRRLAGECTSCHRPDAPGGSIPSITGWEVDDFLATLHFYAKGERKHQAMISVAQSLDETQMRALALHFGSLPKPPKPRSPPTPPAK